MKSGLVGGVFCFFFQAENGIRDVGRSRGLGDVYKKKVHIDGEAKRSCITAIENVAGSDITTIEGLSKDGNHPVQKAWVAEDVPQCGYCQSGQIMTAVALLSRNPDPDEDDINSAMKMNICRCGTYNRIRKGIIKAAKEMKNA